MALFFLFQNFRCLLSIMTHEWFLKGSHVQWICEPLTQEIKLKKVKGCSLTYLFDKLQHIINDLQA